MAPESRKSPHNGTAEEAVSDFDGCQILPSQYFDLLGNRQLTGEQRLLLALLADAINVYQQGVLSHSTRKRLLFIDAERWIMGRSNRGRGLTFETVCDGLTINPSALRRRMVMWKHATQRGEQSNGTRHLRLKNTVRSRRIKLRPGGPAISRPAL